MQRGALLLSRTLPSPSSSRCIRFGVESAARPAAPPRSTRTPPSEAPPSRRRIPTGDGIRSRSYRATHPFSRRPVRKAAPASTIRGMSPSAAASAPSSSDAPRAAASSSDASNDVPPGHELVTEGPIAMLYPKSENSVFYNPVQVQNRDLSVLMLGMHAERRTERRWAARRRKEVRREMLLAKEEEERRRGEEGGKEEEGLKEKKKKETKEERKARAARFEEELAARVAAEKSDVDFAKLTAETSRMEGTSVFEALAASGLRSLRYWREVPGVRSVVVNDLDPAAVELARENVARNGLAGDLVPDDDDDDNGGGGAKSSSGGGDPGGRRVRPPGLRLQVGDASHELYVSRLPPDLRVDQMNPTQRLHQKPRFDVVDLDPYGSAAPFVDGAVQAVDDGGMLAVTCTDMAALGGSHPETCYGRYGAFPIQRAGYLQELALRILLYHLSVSAGRYGRTIRPVLSVGMAFYCRVFVEVYDDKAGVNNLSLNHGHLFQSTKCSSFHITPVATNDYVTYQQQQQQQTSNSDNPNGSDETETTTNGGGRKKNKKNRPSNVYRNGRGPCGLGEPVCAETGAPYKVAGPLWTGPLHDLDVVRDAIARLEAAAENDGVHPRGGPPTHPLHTASTLHGLLVAVSEEVPDAPLYHLLPSLCSAVNSPTIPMATFRAALVNAGYEASAYHKEPSAVKTNAPNHVVWDVVRAWCKEHPPAKRKESKRHHKGEEPGSNAPRNQPDVDIAAKILSKEVRTKVDFTIPKGFGERKKARRWALNPEANWGPKKAASGKNKRKMVVEGNEKVVGAEEPEVKQSRT